MKYLNLYCGLGGNRKDLPPDVEVTAVEYNEEIAAIYTRYVTRLPGTLGFAYIIEHELTDLKGEPVTMLKDQSKFGGLVFLNPHPGYPLMKDISMMKGRPVQPLMECNGFCGTNDLAKNDTMKEINYSLDEY